MNQEARYSILAQMIEECNPDKKKQCTKVNKDQLQNLLQTIYNYSANMKMNQAEVIDFVLNLYGVDLLRELTIAQYEDVMKMLGE